MRRIALCCFLIVGMVLIGGPVSGQVTKAKPKDTKNIPGTGGKTGKDAKDTKDLKDIKDVKKDPGGKFPTEIAGKDLNAWVKAIRDPDASVRQSAMRTVVHFGPPARKKAVPNLITALGEFDVGLKTDAATALGMLGMEDVDMTKGIGMLTRLLGDQQRIVRVHAATSLGQFGYHAKSAVPSLCTALQDSASWEARKAAAYALGHVSFDKTRGVDAQAIRALNLALHDTCVPVRLEVLNSLSKLGLPSQASLVDAEKKALEERVFKDRDKSVVIWSRVLLMLLDEKTYLTAKGLDSVAQYLDDDDLKVRCHAAQALGRLGAKGQPKVSDVIAAAKEKENELALVALASLGYMEDPKAVDVLVKTMKDKEAAMALRSQAAISLGTLRSFGKAGLPALMDMLNAKEIEMVASAIAALAQMGETARPAIPDLKKLSTHKEEAIRKAAEETIKILNEEPKDKKK